MAGLPWRSAINATRLAAAGVRSIMLASLMRQQIGMKEAADNDRRPKRAGLRRNSVLGTAESDLGCGSTALHREQIVGGLEKGHRVDGAAVDADFIMKVAAG